MIDLPVEVALEEIIVRGVCHPYHVKNDKLHWNAFWPPPERDDVSVLRHDYVGADFCKTHAKSLANEQQGKIYKGLSFFNRAAVQYAGADIVDSRSEFLGHADIKHTQKAPPKGHPRDSAELMALVDVCKAIVKKAIYLPDPNPADDKWPCEPVTLPIE